MLTRYGTLGASSRMRAHQYIPHLESAGFEVTVCPLLRDAYLRRRYADETVSAGFIGRAYARRAGAVLQARRYDLLYIEKELFQWMPGPIERLLLSGMPYVVDYDDAIFHTYDRHSSRAVRRLLGGKIAALMRRARLVIAGNEYLATYARHAGAPRVEVLPTAVNLDRYTERQWGEDSPFTVGWIGTPATTKYVELIAPALAEACRLNGRVVLIGARHIDLPGVKTTFLPWSEATETSDILAFDVGVMPLPDEPWARGKCGYKLIQYMASGLPVVASPVGVNTELVEGGLNGFLPTNLRLWSGALSSLREQLWLRRAMGAEGRRKVEQRYCTAVVAPRLVSLLQGAL
jgi:glycosyltransferase involved in cell wall biosynthesis